MPAPDPGHLIEHARRELNPTTKGAPRQVDPRRAASTAYYAVFHCLCGQAADILVSATGGGGSWNLVYRALEHGKAKDRCSALSRSPLKDELQTILLRREFGKPLRDFAAPFVDLQQRRNDCDYDPAFKATKSDVEGYIEDADKAITDLWNSDKPERRDFVSYALFGRR